jgi:hypothetical protein
MNELLKPGLKLGVYGFVLACVACSPGTTEQATELPSTSESVMIKETPESKPAIDLGAIWTQQVSEAIDDLAQRTGVSPDSIVVREARSVDWGSSALGCPEEGMSYADALIPGLRLLLEADSTVYFYHGENGASLFLCPAERAKPPAYGPGNEIM